MLKKLGWAVCCSAALLAGGVWAETKNVDLTQQIQQFSQGRNVAVVVGINTYNPSLSAFNKLDYAVNDAKSLSITLGNRGYDVTPLINGDASKHYILEAIRNAVKTVPNGDGTLVFSFSGHGALLGNENYLATDGAFAFKLQESGLSVSEVVRTIRQSGIKRAVLLLDACRDLPNVRNGARSGFLDRDYGEGIQVLYATKVGDVSWEDPKLQQGVFSYFVNRGLAGALGGVVTFSGLASYVEQEVPKWTRGSPKMKAHVQLPFRDSKGEYRGDFVLARQGGQRQPVRPVVPSEPSPQIPQPAPVVTRPQPAPVTRKSFEPVMIPIPAGSFTMGCKPGRDDVFEGGCENDERPAHTVQISAFLIGKYEVTFDEWDACERARVNPCPHADDEGWGRGRRPVINVSWNDAQTYLQWLSRETGKQYRLPTEAEWEYAARGGRKSAFPWGNQIGCGNASYGYLMDGNPCKSDSTVVVGSYGANGFGLHDTAGNVYEWVGDWYGGYAAASASDPKGPGSGSDRVLRGGSWGESPQDLRSADRSIIAPGSRFSNMGFRPAQVQ